MLRIMGILTGAALAISALIIALGVPKLAPPDDDVASAIQVPPVAEQEVTTETAPVTVVEENWYAFWSPFRSEIAAQGFVARLQETTGIDYRVVKVKTGVYEVTFAYVDAADIEDKLARISDATGLDMSGG